jgi:hypothetical protein
MTGTIGYFTCLGSVNHMEPAEDPGWPRVSRFLQNGRRARHRFI